MSRNTLVVSLVLVVGLTVLGFGLRSWWISASDDFDPEDPLGDIPATSRTLEGVIVFDDQPMPGIDLELREGREVVATGVSDAEGRYSLIWRPRTTWKLKDVRLVATDPKHRTARTIGAPTRRFELEDAIVVDGIVARPSGEPVADVRVQIASLGELYGQAVTAADGTFQIAGLPRNAPLVAFAEGGTIAPRVFRGFTATDRLVLHVEEGKRLRVHVRSPTGEPVAGSTVSMAVPDEFSPRTVTGHDVEILATAGASALLVARAPGHMPVFFDAEESSVIEAVLWPAREVTLLVYDVRRKRGVRQIEAETELAVSVDDRAWNGADPGRGYREFVVRTGERLGEFKIQLPRCPISLVLTADGYADRAINLDDSVDERIVRMSPLRRRPMATLRVLAPDIDEPMPMVVVDRIKDWFAIFEAPGVVKVPAGHALEIASAGAVAGYWVPGVPVPAIPAGQTRVVQIPLRKAAELIVQPSPEGPCVVEVVDKEFKKAVAPQRVSTDGVARFWVRPKREVTATVRPVGNYQPISATFLVEPARREWTAHLLAASGTRMLVKDARGNPVPFALVRYWEAAQGGRLELRLGSREMFADSVGEISLLGLRNGPTPIEILADGFRSVRPRTPDLVEGLVKEGGTFIMQPSARLSGTVEDPSGAPLAGVWLRTVPREFRPLNLPGGGQRDVYDLTRDEAGEAISDSKGRFVVRDSTDRNGLLIAIAHDNADLAPGIAPAASGKLVLPRAARVAMSAPSAVKGVYLLLPNGKAVRVYAPGGMRMNPVPLTLPSGHVELFVRLRNHKTSAGSFELKPGDHRIQMPPFR